MNPHALSVTFATCAALLPLQGQTPDESRAAGRAQNEFELPTNDYHRGLRGRGNFGVLVTRKDSPFAGTHHLAEDVWLPAGTEVRCVADGVVRYSDWSPSWKDEKGRMHWNLGNVIVIEHPLDPPLDGMSHVCSFYVHLGARRLVGVGDAVRKGQPIGCIGKDRSEENGLYPAHLHFGLHRGPYVQISPSTRRELEAAARTTGIVVGPERPVRGEIELLPQPDASVLIRSKADGASILMSLLVGSTAPENKPADIMDWCRGYGDRPTVDEWLRPSSWIADRRKAAALAGQQPRQR
jgi:murein DD-endopeptidase MepM/ murein hydrolase activator NlpD